MKTITAIAFGLLLAGTSQAYDFQALAAQCQTNNTPIPACFSQTRATFERQLNSIRKAVPINVAASPSLSTADKTTIIKGFIAGELAYDQAISACGPMSKYSPNNSNEDDACKIHLIESKIKQLALMFDVQP